MHNKQCPVCNSEMERGHLLMHGVLWESEKNASGVRGLFTKPFKKNVSAYKCTKCGKIEFFFEE